MKNGHLELHAAVLLFGVTGLFGKFITTSPLIIVFGRTASAAIVILLGLKLYKMGLRTAPKKTMFYMSLSGLVLMIHWIIFFYSIQLSTVAIGVIGFSTFPVFVTILEPIFFKQKLRNVDIASGVLVVIGLLFVAPKFSLSDSSTIGLLWAVFSGALYAVLALMNRRLVETNSYMLIAFYQLSIAALCLLPFVFTSEEILDIRTIWLLVILGVICTALPQALFIKSLKMVKAQLASVVIGLESVYGILFAALLLGEIPSIRTVVGAIVVLGAVLLAMKAHSTPAHKIET